jgi:UDP-N-acetyl-D-glucosamine/UDP-N-acetyl-D-galactosamine dehydrogenase
LEVDKKLNRNIKICIVGLGYVGMPLAIEFSKKYKTLGVDNNLKRINDLKNFIDETNEVTNEELELTKLIISNDINDAIDCNIYIITVPTPVDKYNNPDMSPLKSATKSVGKILNKNDIVIYESTVYPGATEQFCVPILEKKSGLNYNKDFFCGYSPERINPGDKKHNLKTIVKVTSGSNNEVANFVDDIYSSIVPAGTHQASSIAVAEAAKVIENVQRDVNIALVNELSMLFNKLNLNTNEVLEAAGTKWNFLPFRPGLVGGHCIGVDPYYLTHRASEIGFNPEIILAGRRINDNMGKHVADETILQLIKAKINPIGAKIAIFGFTFKENCPDLRNTKVIDVFNNLQSYGCDVHVHDPLADLDSTKNNYKIFLEDINNLKKQDCVLLAVPHDFYKRISKEEWKKIINKNGVFIDLKSALNIKLFNDISINYWQL